VIKTSDIEIILFTADWCSPCKSLKAQLKNMGLKKPMREEWVDKNSSMAMSLGVKSIPTIMIYDDKIGKEIDRLVGFQPKKVNEFLHKWGVV